MPRQTRRQRLHTPQKSHLLFVEQPRNGPKHDYGQQLRSAINPRSFISETPRKRSPVSSWVSPQFISQNDTVRHGGRRRKKNCLPTNTMNMTLALSLHQVKRKTAGKYSSLSYKTSTSVSQRHNSVFHKKTATSAGKLPETQDVRHSQGDKPGFSVNQNEVPEETHRQTPITARGQKRATSDPALTPNSKCVKTPLGVIRGKQRTVGSFHTPALEAEDTSTAFTPPHMETPEIPHSVHCLSSPILSIPFFTNQPETPPSAQNSVLVKDTPERDYGLKVTWRRRRKLMNLLSERGQLLVSKAMISKTWL